MDIRITRSTHDFSNLRQPGRNAVFSTTTKNSRSLPSTPIQQMRRISASQLFQVQDDEAYDDQSTSRISNSQPVLTDSNTLPYRRHRRSRSTDYDSERSHTSSSNMIQTFTPCPRRKYMPHEQYFDSSYWTKKSPNEVRQGGFSRTRAASTGPSSGVDRTADDNKSTKRCNYYENMYERVQKKLKKHIRREEVFSQQEIQKACQDIRRQSNEIVLQDNWKENVDIQSQQGLDTEILQAVYLLQNSHRKELFRSKDSLQHSAADDAERSSEINKNGKVSQFLLIQ